MKKSFFLMAALLVAMTGCNKEPQMESGDLSSDAKVYVSFSVQALATRTGTDASGDTNSDASPDYEVGFDKENAISSVDIVLRNESSFIKATVNNPLMEENDGADVAKSPKKWVATFSSNQLEANTEYEVYIYANCSAKQDIHATSYADIDEMTQSNRFWMTNAYKARKVKFESFSTNINAPTDLGTHYVERAMARFDYMPKGDYTLTGYYYEYDFGGGMAKSGSIEVIEPSVTPKVENFTITVKLIEAALINQSQEFYLLRRVSDEGTKENWEVGGVETPFNYVVDSDYDMKSKGLYEEPGVIYVNPPFKYHMTDPETWEWKSLTNLDQPDNWDGENDGTDDPLAGEGGKEESTPEHPLNEYYIWQYCKENTIPGIDKQLNGISTGVVFKGQLSGDIVNYAASIGSPLYVFENVLYGSWGNVVEASRQSDATESLKFAVEACSRNGELKPSDSKILSDAGFTVYKKNEDGNYYTYYYYWNRHNDNGDNQNMGVMEFAVVRNNVYKLCVDNILKYGHPDPNDPDPVDPDPIDPTDPDEGGELYFQVTAKVLPWVVRVNHIEF